ncbi:MAG TPA: hypothetical protein VGP72_06900 [Planctomycetota bacterium]|jgi:hypothetical protein
MEEPSEPCRPELTREQLQDLVVVAHAPNDAEAIYLIDTLDEAGIPVGGETERIGHGLSSGQRICVPRVLAEKARELIEKARAEAHDRGIEVAFDPESVADATYDEKDPVMMRMFELRCEPEDVVAEELRSFVMQWTIDGIGEVQIAKYLAAAGLNREQSAALVAMVTQDNMPAIEEGQHAYSALGILLFLLAIMLTLASLAYALAMGAHYFLVFSGLGLAGMTLMFRSKSKAPDLARREPSLPADANSSTTDN